MIPSDVGLALFNRIVDRYDELRTDGYDPDIIIMHPAMAQHIITERLPWVKNERGKLVELYTDYGQLRVLLDETWPVDTFHITARRHLCPAWSG